MRAPPLYIWLTLPILASAAPALADYYRFERYAMPEGGTLAMVDFHYDNLAACQQALAQNQAAMRQSQPKLNRTDAGCHQQMAPEIRAMLSNQKAPMPYFSFQDLRQWLEGVPAEKKANFCEKTAQDGKFRGQARCIR